MAKICIDISNIVPGKGGSGGGIVTYSKHIAELFDKIDVGNDKIILLKHKDFNVVSSPHQIQVKQININTKNFFIRVLFVHFFLPIYCLANKIDLLYRVTPELPLIKVCKYACTLPDFMFDFYLERPAFKKYLGFNGYLKFYFFRWITMHALKVADLILVFSNTLKADTIKKNQSTEPKIFVTKPATDIEYIAKSKISATSKAQLQIGVIAGFYPHKGHFRVLQLAIKLLKADFTNFNITFRGNPAFVNYQADLKKFIKVNNLEHNVQFVGYEPNATLADIYESFDIFLLLTEYEGFGLPVLEAQAFNKPVFCSDIPILREVLGESAFYIDIFSDKFDITHFIKVIQDNEVLADLIVKGESNLQRFSWEKMCLEKYAAFKTILS